MRLIIMIALAFVFVGGCSSIKVARLNPEKPDGLPFYLTKPMVKVSQVKYIFKKLPDLSEVYTIETLEKEIVTVQDKKASYTINNIRSFVGESTFKVERSSGTSTNNSDIAKVEVVNKEGVTEFLKGLFEGSKSLAEAAKTIGMAAPPPGLLTTEESNYFQKLVEKDILVFKTVEKIWFEELN